MELGIAGRIAGAFVDSKLTPLIVAASLALGALALLATPREEEPQIRVPMVDVTLLWPGAEPREVASRVVEPVERILYGIAGVDHVYSVAGPGMAMVTVRFRVNEPNEESLVKVFERHAAIAQVVPPDVRGPMVELHSIDDVPFLTLTLYSPEKSSDGLRPIAAELARELSEVEQTTRVQLIGGSPRRVRIEPDPDRLAALDVTWAELVGVFGGAGRPQPGGTAVRDNRERRVDAGPSFTEAAQLERVVVAVRAGKPVYVSDVARVIDGPGEAASAVFYVPGPASPVAAADVGRAEAAVTIALAKRPGANATTLAEAVLGKVEELRPRLIPGDVRMDVTRNYGKTADEKSNELVEHLLIATLSVIALISLAMGWRAGLVVGVAVPVTLALTLLIYFLAGYTLNRVTLFALIFSIGILVDDAIVVVENIERYYASHEGKGLEGLRYLAVRAVDEVGNPTILATFTVIAAILPMAFVRGLMGPYMRPIPTGASAAMIFSLGVAFIVSPWAAYRVFRRHAESHELEAREEGRATRLYRRMMESLIARRSLRGAFLVLVVALLFGSAGLVAVGLVKVKMLPFDNKSEFQVMVNHPEGTPLEVTLETAREMTRYLTSVPEVRDVQIYAGTAAPFNFNGLVRHYFLRQSPWGADLQVNLADKHDREEQSHAIAKRVRPELTEIARRRGARVKVVEIPPGPPVLDTLVAEIYGPTPEARRGLAGAIRGLFEQTAGVVDVDDSLEAPRTRTRIDVDREKVALEGVSPAAVVDAVSGAGEGRVVGHLAVPSSRELVPIEVGLSEVDRASLDRRLALRVPSPAGGIALGELTSVRELDEEQPVQHKDLKPVVYVFGDMAGVRESPIYALMDLNEAVDGLELPDGSGVERYAIEAPVTSDRPALKWDGEWQITYEVFRDLGLAFAVVLVLIAILVVGWFQSFRVPLAILLPIPLSLVGILPGHLLFGAFFTATSMIGFIAGAGIIVRNSIILVDFIELKLGEGMPLERAVVEAGVVRFRPMLLTAAAVVVGGFVILFDPIFQGLAISLMAGEVAATLLSRVAVPIVYYMLAGGTRARELAAAS
jgi:multidrug efflux pump subunit AcrB